MNKTTKGAAAAGAAAVLLLGGAGSLAYWTSTASLNGGAINSGYLTLTAGACDTTFKYTTANPNSNPLNTANSPVVLFTPGDIVYKNCTFTIAARGDNLSATPTLPADVTIPAAPTPPNATAPASFKATTAASYTLTTAGANPTTSALTNGKITSANDGQTLTARIQVNIPFGTNETAPRINANDTQRITATLGALAITLTQDNYTGTAS